MPSVLFVLSSADKTLTGNQTVSSISPIVETSAYHWPWLPKGMVSTWSSTPLLRTGFSHHHWLCRPCWSKSASGRRQFKGITSLCSIQIVKLTISKAFGEDPVCVKFLNDETVQTKLANAKKLVDIKVNDYDAIFYVGGHGPVMDLPTDPTNIKLASQVSLIGMRRDCSQLTSTRIVLAGRKDCFCSLPRSSVRLI